MKKISQTERPKSEQIERKKVLISDVVWNPKCLGTEQFRKHPKSECSDFGHWHFSFLDVSSFFYAETLKM